MGRLPGSKTPGQTRTTTTTPKPTPRPRPPPQHPTSTPTATRPDGTQPWRQCCRQSAGFFSPEKNPASDQAKAEARELPGRKCCCSGRFFRVQKVELGKNRRERAARTPEASPRTRENRRPTRSKARPLNSIAVAGGVVSPSSAAYSPQRRVKTRNAQATNRHEPRNNTLSM